MTPPQHHPHFVPQSVLFNRLAAHRVSLGLEVTPFQLILFTAQLYFSFTACRFFPMISFAFPTAPSALYPSVQRSTLWLTCYYLWLALRRCCPHMLLVCLFQIHLTKHWLHSCLLLLTVTLSCPLQLRKRLRSMARACQRCYNCGPRF